MAIQTRRPLLLLVIAFAAMANGSKAVFSSSNSNKFDHNLPEAVHIFDKRIDDALLVETQGNGKQQQAVEIVAKLNAFFVDFDEFQSTPGAEKIFDANAVNNAKSTASPENIQSFWESPTDTSSTIFDKIFDALQNIKVVKGAAEHFFHENTSQKEFAQALSDLQTKIDKFMVMLKVKLTGAELLRIEAEFKPKLEVIIETKVDEIKKRQKRVTVGRDADIAKEERKWRQYQLLLQASMKLLNSLENSPMEARILAQHIVGQIFVQIGGKHAQVPDIISRNIKSTLLHNWLTEEQQSQAQLWKDVKKEQASIVRNNFIIRKRILASNNEAALFESRIRLVAAKVLILYEEARTLLLDLYKKGNKMTEEEEEDMARELCQQLKGSKGDDWPQQQQQQQKQQIGHRSSDNVPVCAD